MGIHGLAKLIAESAPSATSETKFENYFGRKVVIDASMHIYQFMIVVGRVGDQVLTDEAGNVTAHLQGLYFRTIRMLEAGIKPVYVFDGKPPQFKSGELAKRKAKRDEAQEALKQAVETGDQEAIEKFSKRTVRVTQEHNEECKRLLRLMGVPCIEAPCEAEAQCAELCKAGLVHSAATEDMDILTFACPKQSRYMMAPASKQQAVVEYSHDKVLEEFGITHESFVDLCILCGCDYMGTIKGIGPKRALELVQKYKSLEEILEVIDRDKFPVPEDYPFKEVRELFLKPDVTPATELADQLKWGQPDEEGIVSFLCGEKNFSEDRVRNGVKKIRESKGKGSQGRLDSFFGAVTVKKSDTGKRKAEQLQASKGKKGRGGLASKTTKSAKGRLGGVGGGSKR
ncbi:unnamed protein product [Pedinophyceae sp. YPF-701]|nr:unnamed protein product [Pedinophyceae sp. YPF-701]